MFQDIKKKSSKFDFFSKWTLSINLSRIDCVINIRVNWSKSKKNNNYYLDFPTFPGSNWSWLSSDCLQRKRQSSLVFGGGTSTDIHQTLAVAPRDKSLELTYIYTPNHSLIFPSMNFVYIFIYYFSKKQIYSPN